MSVPLAASVVLTKTAFLQLQEPPKAELLAFERGGKYPTRMASVVMTKPPKSNPIEMELNLEEGSVGSYKTVRLSYPCSLVYFPLDCA